MELYDINANIEVRDTGKYGKSLFAKRDFKKDEIVFVVFGKVVNYHTDYTIPIDHNLMIEPRTPKGNPVQYLCHSCNPNIGIHDRTIFVAMRDILSGEEVLTHYGFLGYEFGCEMTENGKERKIFDSTCHCGAESCFGRMRGYSEFTPDERERYREYISDYLLDDNRYPYKH